ncbi:MAG TPA: DUF1732 domain-containing protein [Candidatus Egerieousia sp.]|nr:DUF1732 domain-containing protein [Candidatus Egerieousia sp.]HPT06120.1 DUF1732 domain-containing protein [Candidatus Egerieousia sp.]
MVKSMTGYGKAECILSDNSKVIVEIRTLNGKSADINFKSNFASKDKELEIRQYLTQQLHRGTIDFFINQTAGDSAAQKTINKEVFEQYYDQLKNLQEFHKSAGFIGTGEDPVDEAVSGRTHNGSCDGNGHGYSNYFSGQEYPSYTSDSILMSAVMKLPDILQTKEQVISDADWQQITETIRIATDKLNNYRETEGKALYDDVTKRVGNIKTLLDEVKKQDVTRVPAIKERLKSKIAEAAIPSDPNRLEQEIVFYVEKLDINEEKVRLAQHCKYFMQTIDGETDTANNATGTADTTGTSASGTEEYPGKKLGFIIQEMGREINTIGSKANDAEIQKFVIRMKDELEKIREQSMNIL